MVNLQADTEKALSSDVSSYLRDGSKGAPQAPKSAGFGEDTTKDLDEARSITAGIEDTDPPDGGVAAWTVVFGAWCCLFSSAGWVNSVGIFEQYYEVGPLRHYSSSSIAWIPSLQLFFLYGLGPFIGIIFDKYGPRHLIVVGSFLHVFGLMMASLATEYYQFMLSQGVCSAIGVSCICWPALACVSTWFVKRRGVAVGVMVTGSSLAGVVFPIMLDRMVTDDGYPWAIRTAAFLILGLQILAVFTVRPRTKPVQKKMPRGHRLAAPFTELPFVLLMLGILVLAYGIFTPIVYLAVQGYQQAHMSEHMSQYLVAIFNGASLFGRLGSGHGADLIGRWNMFIIACFISGIALFALWIPANDAAVTIAFSAVFGFVSGAFLSLFGVLPVSVSALDELGYRLGLVLLAISIPALTTGVICGAILDRSWLDLEVFAGGMCLAGTAIVAVSRWLFTKRKILTVF